MIRADDRVARVLERDERLVDVFVACSPFFERLRRPAMRRAMARLVTVEQAARIAGLDPDTLVDRLNRALGSGPGSDRTTDPLPEPTGPADGTDTMMTTEPRPATLADLPPHRIVDLDVRQDLRDGQEPFSRIMRAKQGLSAGQVLRVRAIFEPAPLYHVLGKQGYGHWTERLADEDWRVWFYRSGNGDDGVDAQPPAPSAARAAGAVPAPVERDRISDDAGAGEGVHGGVVVLDVRGMEPPEPMVRTLAALETLPSGGTLVQLNVRVPQFLLPRLDALGFVYEVREQDDSLVRLFIRRP